MLESHTLSSLANTAPAIPSRGTLPNVHKFRHWLNSCAIRSLQFHWDHKSDLPFPPCHPLPALPALLLSMHWSYRNASPACSVTAERLQDPLHLPPSITTMCDLLQVTHSLRPSLVTLCIAIAISIQAKDKGDDRLSTCHLCNESP
ncbi:hypothetical protein LSAT2_027809 [Lamellibrachia satsuma]|nr:hypothetical protein LSAT2_027809 [Lamellibrachia satsuma]